MNNFQQKVQISLHVAFAIAALLILADFILPGKIIKDVIIGVKKERQQYYNAAKNFHYSYQIITNEHKFSAQEEFAKKVQANEYIEYSVSRIFSEINWYRLLSSQDTSTYSLRIISGLVLPIVMILLIFVASRYKKNISTLVFVFQVLMVADLVYLLN